MADEHYLWMGPNSGNDALQLMGKTQLAWGKYFKTMFMDRCPRCVARRKVGIDRARFVNDDR
jgi:hypothetical protein